MVKSFFANIPITISWTDTGLRNITLLSDLFVLTLYNVCSVHRETFSTLGDTMSTLRGSTSEDVQYIWGDTMSTSGGHHEYIGECSVHRRIT